jgi:hypothetical protein
MSEVELKSNPVHSLSPLDRAINLGQLGYRVFPVKPGEKIPAIKGWQNTASCDETAISTMLWRSNSNIGIATAGLSVVDIDQRKNDRKYNMPAAKTAREILVKCARELPFPVVTTPTGGKHILGRPPEGTTCASGSRAELGIDTRGEGGFIVAAGSSVGGNFYTSKRPLPHAGGLPRWPKGVLEAVGAKLSGSSRAPATCGTVAGFEGLGAVPAHITARKAALAAAGLTVTNAFGIGHEVDDPALVERLSTALAILAATHATDREPWLAVMLALKNSVTSCEIADETAFELADQFSSNGVGYRGTDDIRAWWDKPVAPRDKPRGLGSIFADAKLLGWVDPRSVTAPAGDGVVLVRLPSVTDVTSLLRFPSTAPETMLPSSYAIKGVIAARWLTVIYGASGSAKSFVAGESLYLVAMGKLAFGRRTKRTPVLYVCLEGESDFEHNRVAVWKRLHGDAGHWFATLAVPASLNNTDPSGVALVIAAANELKRLCGTETIVVCIDTLARAMAGDDENSAKDMAALTGRLKVIADACNAATVVVHHSGKDATRGMRGSSSLFAACDAVVEISAAPEDQQTGDGYVRRVSIEKLKSGQVGTWFDFKLQQHLLGRDDDGDNITSCSIDVVTSQARVGSVLDLPDDAREAFEALAKCLQVAEVNGAASIPIEAWRTAVYCAWSGKAETKRRRFNRARKTLTLASLVNDEKRGVSLRNSGVR